MLEKQSKAIYYSLFLKSTLEISCETLLKANKYMSLKSSHYYSVKRAILHRMLLKP